MDWMSLVIALVSAAVGWAIRHYQTPAHHGVIDDALAEIEKAKALDKVRAAVGIGVNWPPTTAAK